MFASLQLSAEPLGPHGAQIIGTSVPYRNGTAPGNRYRHRYWYQVPVLVPWSDRLDNHEPEGPIIIITVVKYHGTVLYLVVPYQVPWYHTVIIIFLT